MSNRLYQTVLYQMKDVIGRTIGVIDENGIIIASSELSMIGEARQRIKEELTYANDSIAYENYTYRFFGNSKRSEYIAFIEGTDQQSVKMLQMLSIALDNIKGLYDEKYDKNSFIKNIILDNILPSDIYVKSNELHFNNDEKRAVMVVKFPGISRSATPLDIIQGIVPENDRDFVISISEQDIVIVKALAQDEDEKSLEAFARSVISKVNSEHAFKVLIGISSVVENLKDLARAYKEAKISLEVGKVFDIEKPIMAYDSLGIGRIIYQLPTTLCEIFLSEVFKEGSLESLDKETLMTVQSFFENNLNVSETSRKLFVHRNTLVYRLEKIRKLTGLDLREFDHAVTFKVALMVKKYLSARPAKF